MCAWHSATTGLVCIAEIEDKLVYSTSKIGQSPALKVRNDDRSDLIPLEYFSKWEMIKQQNQKNEKCFFCGKGGDFKQNCKSSVKKNELPAR